MRAAWLSLAVCLAAAGAHAGEVKAPAMACGSKAPLDRLTMLAASGNGEALARMERRYLETKVCVRLQKGARVEIVDARRVLAGDRKIRRNEPHRRVAYVMATVKANGKTWFMHLQNVRDP